MKNKHAVLNQFYETCREHGLRVTPQRVLLFETMIESLDHPTAEGVYQKVRHKMPNISYDTVNRTLLSFAELGIIKIVQSRGSAKRFDAYLASHHHFQCVKCNRIIDFQYAKYDQMEVPTGLPKNLIVLDKKVVLEGICDQCKK